MGAFCEVVMQTPTKKQLQRLLQEAERAKRAGDVDKLKAMIRAAPDDRVVLATTAVVPRASRTKLVRKFVTLGPDGSAEENERRLGLHK